jgi:hypothetical protein
VASRRISIPHLDRVRLPLLLGYIALLVLAAWREEIRPAFLDRSSIWAERTLRRVGIFAGIAVFSPEVKHEERQLFLRQRCLEVLAESAGAPPERIYPEAECPAVSPRIRVGPHETMLTRLMNWAADDEVDRRATGRRPGPGEVTLPEAILPSIAYHFDRQERLAGRPRDRFTMLYTHHMVRYDTGERTVEPIVLFRFTVGGTEPGRVLWHPTERQLATLWHPESAR